MKKQKRRLEQLSERLTAKERALLGLQALKEGEPADAIWRSTMPDDQRDEFEGYVRKFAGLNAALEQDLLVLQQEVEKHALRFELIGTLILWGSTGWDSRLWMRLHAKEPVTESEYRVGQAQARSHPIAVDELAEISIDGSAAAQAASLEELEQLKQHRAQELAALVDRGILIGGEEDGHMHVQAGSYYDWLGEPVPTHPSWACEYEVLPDDQAQKVSDWRDEMVTMSLTAEVGPMLETARLQGIDERLAQIAERTPADDQLEGNVCLLRAGVAGCWRRLGAIEEVVEEVRHDLDGEDPLVPHLREIIDASRARLEAFERNAHVVGPLGAEEPREEDREWVRHGMDAAS